MITKIAYKRVKNLGDYETETIEVEANVSELDNPDDVIRELRSFVMKRLYSVDPYVVTEDDLEGELNF